MAMQQGQQQVAPAYVQMQAPGAQQRNIYDPLSNLVGGSNTGLYLGNCLQYSIRAEVVYQHYPGTF